ncbi:MAG TPA: 2-oxo acid dehydrogenase subunit E2 [Deinococcales bacterium]|nr:2-oxo acid dehydrogenase subunit E2 [Deinococcales bacterium]
MNAGERLEWRPFGRLRGIERAVASLARERNLMRALVEVDVTLARERLRAHRAATGEPVSLTALLVSSLAKAAAEHPEAHAMVDWRGRLAVPKVVDVALIVEADSPEGPVPLGFVLRNADRKTPAEIDAEIRAAKKRGGDNGPVVQAAGRFPIWAQRLALRYLLRRPAQVTRLMGTIGVTAVGMFGRRGGWGLALPILPLGVTVGGVARKPGVVGQAILPREFLSLTLDFDHDAVDGAPAARFTERFCRLLETAALLETPPAAVEGRKAVAAG